MSNYYCLKCSLCGDESESRNHGDEALRELKQVYAAAREHMMQLHRLGFLFPKECLEKLHSRFPEDTLRFLIQHDGHPINIMSEYSSIPEEVFCEGEPEEPEEKIFQFLLEGQSPEDWFPSSTEEEPQDNDDSF